MENPIGINNISILIKTFQRVKTVGQEELLIKQQSVFIHVYFCIEWINIHLYNVQITCLNIIHKYLKNKIAVSKTHLNTNVS